MVSTTVMLVSTATVRSVHRRHIPVRMISPWARSPRPGNASALLLFLLEQCVLVRDVGGLPGPQQAGVLLAPDVGKRGGHLAGRRRDAVDLLLARWGRGVPHAPF